MLDMFGKLNEMKQKMEETKARLSSITVDASAGDGMITVVMTADKTVKSISIDDSLLTADKKEELIDYLEIAMNKALEKAGNVSESEMMAAGKGLLPNIPGLF